MFDLRFGAIEGNAITPGLTDFVKNDASEAVMQKGIKEPSDGVTVHQHRRLGVLGVEPTSKNPVGAYDPTKFLDFFCGLENVVKFTK